MNLSVRMRAKDKHEAAASEAKMSDDSGVFLSGNWRVGNGPLLQDIMRKKADTLKLASKKRDVIEYWNTEKGIYLDLLKRKPAVVGEAQPSYMSTNPYKNSSPLSPSILVDTSELRNSASDLDDPIQIDSFPRIAVDGTNDSSVSTVYVAKKPSKIEDDVFGANSSDLAEGWPVDGRGSERAKSASKETSAVEEMQEQQQEEEELRDQALNRVATCYDDCVIAPDGYLPNSVYLRNCRKWDRKLHNRWQFLVNKYHRIVRVPRDIEQPDEEDELQQQFYHQLI